MRSFAEAVCCMLVRWVVYVFELFIGSVTNAESSQLCWAGM